MDFINRIKHSRYTVMTTEKKICVGVASCAPWLKSGVVSLEDFSRTCKDIGFDAIEPCDRSIQSCSPDRIRQLKKYYRSLEMKVVCLDIRNDFTVTDETEWENQVQHVKDWLQAAHELEIPVARIWTGESSADEEARKRVYRAINQLMRTAEHCGVTMAVENHGGLSNDPWFLSGLASDFQSPFLRLCADFGNFPSDIRYAALEAILPFSVHIHAKTYEFSNSGSETTINYEIIEKMLTKIEYNGYFSIEFEGNVSSLQDNLTGIQMTEKLLRMT